MDVRASAAMATAASLTSYPSATPSPTRCSPTNQAGGARYRSADSARNPRAWLGIRPASGSSRTTPHRIAVRVPTAIGRK